MIRFDSLFAIDYFALTICAATPDIIRVLHGIYCLRLRL